jgi:hypothetical protein
MTRHSPSTRPGVFTPCPPLRVTSRSIHVDSTQQAQHRRSIKVREEVEPTLCSDKPTTLAARTGRDEERGALAHGAAATHTVTVPAAIARNELRAGRLARARRCGGRTVRNGRSGGVFHPGRGLGIRSRDLLRCVVVRGWVAKAAPAIAFLCNDGAGALAGLEATAPRRTVSITAAHAGDELRARRSCGRRRSRRRRRGSGGGKGRGRGSFRRTSASGIGLDPGSSLRVLISALSRESLLLFRTSALGP